MRYFARRHLLGHSSKDPKVHQAALEQYMTDWEKLAG
jgi:3'-phosphoadenosine 5'-phosphosulfate sulfotransferase